MEMIEYKPLGSIIKIQGAKKKFMIIARAISTSLKKGEEPKFFDYACVMYPEGLIGNNLFYIQDSDITEVYFEGFTDEENDRALKALKPVLEKLETERFNTKPEVALANDEQREKE